MKGLIIGMEREIFSSVFSWSNNGSENRKDLFYRLAIVFISVMRLDDVCRSIGSVDNFRKKGY